MPSTRIAKFATFTSAIAATSVLTGLTVSASAAPAPAGAIPAASTSATSTTKVTINAGGADVVVGHTTWQGDRFAVGGHAVRSSASITGTTADAFYRRARVGMSGYRIPVGVAGNYRVTLKFAEIQSRRPGQRVFAVAAEGKRIVRKVDIAAAAGKDRAVSISRTVRVRDGVLDLTFPARRGPALISGIAVANASAAYTPARVSASSTRGITRRSGLAWASGVYDPSGSPSGYEAFGAWRGRRVDVATMWTARNSWSDLVNPDWLYRTWSGTPMTKVVGVSPIPEGDSSATMARCADGRYDDKWAAFAKNIKAAGMDDETIIRLGWEFNGDWYKWAAKSPGEFVSCWRHIVGAAERVAPRLRWDWTVNRGAGQSLRDARKAWPGNRYVDIVGIDSYDVWPAVTTTAAWNTHLKGEFGLDFWRDFAKAHGKRLSVPEWGVYPGTSHNGHNGGDNAYYVKKMNSFFRSNASMIAYESYFNESASYYGGSLYGPTQNPRAASAYRAAW